MPMISYASNLEDVILDRVFRDRSRGTFIDIGAGEPILENVSWHFYQQGWRGVDVEPIARLAAALRETRPGDTTVEAALGARSGELTFYENLDQWGTSTMSAVLASGYEQRGERIVERTVAVQTLADVCATHVTGIIDFCKVDVEGFETAVLEGADFRRWRPRVMVIASAIPLTMDQAPTEWESVMVDNRYIPAYFDGVNRYYVADEARELLPILAVQPNWIDQYTPFREILLKRHIATLEEYLARVQEDSRLKLAERSGEVTRLEQKLSAFRRSRVQVLAYRDRRGRTDVASDQ